MREAARLRQTLADQAVSLALIVVSIIYAGAVTLLHTGALSPIDEWVYVDYLHKIPTQGIVREGELVGDRTLEILACDGVSPFGEIGTPCGQPLDPEDFPNTAISTASAYTPIYFLFTRALGDVVAAATGLDQLDGWRLTGSAWLAAGLIVMLCLFRRWQIPRLTALSVGLALIASPFGWWTYTYVSTDAPSLFFGALLLLLAVDVGRGTRSPWWIVGVGAVAALFKITNLIGVALAALYLGFVLLGELRAPTRPVRLRALLGVPLLAILVGSTLQVVWMRLAQLWSANPERADQGITVPLTPEELLLQVTSFLPGAIGSSPIGAYVPDFVYAPLGWICVAGVLTALFLTPRILRTEPMILAVGLSAFVAAPLLAITLQLAVGTYFQLPPRYGATLLPGILVVTALVLRGRIAGIVVASYGVALLGVGVWLSAHLATLA